MTVYNVSTAAELTAALNSASGGDEIRLAGGNYGALNLNTKFSSEVKIVSDDASNPASFSTMNLNGASNLTFDGVVFDYTFSQGDKLWDAPFRVTNSSNITIQNSKFDGDVASGMGAADDGYGAAKGLVVTGSDSVTLSGNEIYDFWKGAQFDNSTNLLVQNNEVHSLRSDGFNFVDVQGVVIEQNYFHDFAGSPTSGDHADMIQFWTNNTTQATTDVYIRDNTFDIGQGSWSQTIFMRNLEAEKGNASLYYQNVNIENNVIYNSHLHGITVGETNGLVISNNTLVQADGDPNFAKTGGALAPPRINVSSSSTNVTIDQNVTNQVTGYNGQSSWTVQDNALIQDKDSSAPGFYGDVFTNASLTANTPYHDYDVQPGSIIDTLGAGATLPHPEDSQSGSVTPAPTPAPAPEDPAPVDPDPTDTASPAPAPVDPDPTDTASPAPTPAPAPVDPTPPQDPTDVVTAPAPVDDTGFDALDFDAYVMDFDALSGSNALKGDTQVVTTASGEQALYLDGKKDKAQVGRIQEVEDSEQLSFSIDFQRDTADGATERLLWNHQKVGLTLVGDGLEIQIANNDNKFHDGFVLKDLGLNDTEKHQVAVIVDAETDRVQVIVDGQVVLDDQSLDLDFVGAGGREWGWSVGPMWGNGFDGHVYDFRVDDEADFYDQPAIIDDTMAVFG